MGRAVGILVGIDVSLLLGCFVGRVDGVDDVYELDAIVVSSIEGYIDGEDDSSGVGSIV